MSTLRRKTTSYGPPGGAGSSRLCRRNVTTLRSGSDTSQCAPARWKWRTSMGAGRPRFTSSWLYVPARARFSTCSDRSVAVMDSDVPASRTPSSTIAMEYGSCPVEHAADHTRRVSSRPRCARSAGTTCWDSAVNGAESRNHDVSLVVSASTTPISSVSRGWARSART